MPVGVAIKRASSCRYLAWGHPSENNCTRKEATGILRNHLKHDKCLFHNSAFDIDVGQTHLGLPFPRDFEDTLFLGYLRDPRQRSLALKPMADQWLNMPPDEQQQLKDWILNNIPEAKRKPSQWGAHIAKAPGGLVGKYAKGDVIRTHKLYKLFLPYVREMEMVEAYEVEKDIVKIKLSMERHGIQTADKRLKRDLPKWIAAHDAARAAIFRKLKITKAYEADCPKGFFNLNSGEQLADAIELAGLTEYWIYTEKGNRSTSLENLQEVVTDKNFLKIFGVYATLEKYITGFLTPWIETGNKDGLGRVYPTFNQVRSEPKYGGKGGGTKTGRPSVSNPNFNNIPANANESKNAATLADVKKWVKNHGINFIGLRDYITPSQGNYLIARDYKQQELRVLAHYEDGALMQSFLDNPNLDIHEAVRIEIYERTGVKLTRKAVKKIAFGILYGFGLDTLAEELGTTRDEASKLKRVYMQTLPGVPELQKELKQVAKRDDFIRTAGGRVYYCEDPRYVEGRLRTYDYKLLNLLIQGTSADITKRAMIRAAKSGALKGQMIIQLYDEIIVDTPDYKYDMGVLKEAMEGALPLDVALPTDGDYSKVSWGRMRGYKD
jgi:DNA polymerase-1